MTPEAAPSGPISNAARRGVYLLFFLSGASALLFETLWTYQATLALGSGYRAVTAVLSAFMCGLALGNLLSLRRSVWTLATYAGLEWVILMTGLAALFLLPLLGRLLAPVFGAAGDRPGILLALRFLLSFLVLALPSTAMGMTLPALAQALGGEQGSFRAILGRLYGLNTLGAIGGALAAETLLLPALGVYGTGACAAALNGAAALGAWKLAARPGMTPAPQAAAWDRKVPRSLTPAFVSVFLAGFVLLALEVIWTRFLALFVMNSSLAFVLMLATVLAGIALGGIAGSTAWIRRPFAFLILFAAALALVGSYRGFSLCNPTPGVPIWSPGKILWVGFALQFPVSFLSGVFFTAAGATFRDRIASSQASAGLLVLANTVGAALGAALAGFLLLPTLGIEKSFFAMAVVYGLAALLWAWADAGDRRWLLVGAGAWLAGLAFFPFGHFRERHIPALTERWAPPANQKIAAVREGQMETIVYLELRDFDRLLYHRMLVNVFSMSGNPVAGDRYMKQFVYWPVALHPAPRRALLICYGVGSTARALTRTRELEQIDVVDLSPDVLSLSTVVYPDPSTNPLKDPRVTVHVEDGRFFLETRGETWDIITGEPPPPNVAGIAPLYSLEYFRLLRERLSEGGIATYWLPIQAVSEPAACSILKSWSEVFETCFLWRGARDQLMLVGIRGRPARVSEERFTAQWRDPAVLSDLTDLGFELPELLGTGFVGDAEYLRAITRDASPTEDAFPKRIAAPGPENKTLFESWYDRDASVGRFLRSRSIGEIWPPRLFERTLPYFEWEMSLTSLGSYPWRSRVPPFSEFHRLVTATPLRTLVAWALESDRDLCRAARQADPAVQSQPRPQAHLGAQALADRDYAGAAEHYLRTVGVPGMRKTDLMMCLYSLCMAGRKEEAERTLARVWDERLLALMTPDFWPWMAATFGLRTPTGTGKPK
jgi:predicted membrane-bound spermidine synthase